jgi:ketosteroid isomerase-like protein
VPPTQALTLNYSTALARMDPDAIVASLAEDIEIVVAVHDAPMHGRDVARFLFGVLSEELSDFRVTEEIGSGDSVVVLFEASLAGMRAQGLNVVRLRGGEVTHLTVFFRPLPVLQKVSDVVGARMAARFGEIDQ